MPLAKLALLERRSDMTDFPTIMYRTPGPLRRTGGRGTYDIIGADNAEQFKELSAKGWYPSYDAACGGKNATKVIAAAEALEDAIDDVSAPTREELEAKAEELGIGFNKRTSNKKLAERIAEALEG